MSKAVYVKLSPAPEMLRARMMGTEKSILNV